VKRGGGQCFDKDAKKTVVDCIINIAVCNVAAAIVCVTVVVSRGIVKL